MRHVWWMVAVLMVLSVAACAKKQTPLARPMPPPVSPGTTTPGTRPPAPPEPVAEPTVVPPEPVRDDAISSASLDDLNRNSPLKPVFFEYNKSDLTPEAQRALDDNAGTLKKYSTWAVTIEGHCDERGSAEYNLGLGDRRASAAKEFLQQLGVPADRLKTVSYGKERPQCSEQDESCWQKNRRVHFVPGQ